MNSKKNIESKDAVEKSEFGWNNMKEIMYGYGEVQHPNIDTLKLIERYLIEFIEALILKGANRTLRLGYPCLKMRDIIYFVKGSNKMLIRGYTFANNFSKITMTKRMLKEGTLNEIKPNNKDSYKGKKEIISSDES